MGDPGYVRCSCLITLLVYSSLAGERTDFQGKTSCCIVLRNLTWGLEYRVSEPKNVEELMRCCSYFSVLHPLLSKSIVFGYRVLQISCSTLFYPNTGQRYCTCYYHRQFAIDLFSYLLLLGPHTILFKISVCLATVLLCLQRSPTAFLLEVLDTTERLGIES